ncbi:MAG TPA: Rossmann-like and DUF2520 domain-containing protein [Candidatus Polarisedimenticolia bacterium]|nr:Rossmann-like and DUF2520 domain-containing protein [Candidatus Polarisedimenticolia bacterium]
MKKRLRFVLVGPGAVGSALSSALRRRGHREVARYGRGGRRGTRAGWADLDEPFDLLLIAVPDREIAPLARRWAKRQGWRGKFVFHTSGALGSSVLAPLARRGALTGTLHPLTSLPRGSAKSTALRDIGFGIEGDVTTRRLAFELVREIGGWPLALRGRSRAAYHLGACFASGYLLALVSIAAEMMARGGSLRKPDSRRSALALARVTLENAERAGLEEALTGPLVRRDLSTVRKHLQVLRQMRRDRAVLHRILALQMAEMLRRAGRIGPRDASEARRVLKSRSQKP